MSGASQFGEAGTGWAVLSYTGAPDEIPNRRGRTVIAVGVSSPMLVLGSTQPSSVVDRSAAAAVGVEVVRRRTGGGAVLVRPAELLWVELGIDREDPLWVDDISRSALWLGEVWRAALEALGIHAQVWEGAFSAGEWGRVACFASRAPGEVVVHGPKAVGIAQHRTRGRARFQCGALLGWDPRALTDLLALSPPERARAAAALGGEGIGIQVPGPELLDEFLRHLP